ncbi:MAG: hypothetical protein ACE5KZ_11495 [Candidatus Scalinduaceae bacterium]
MKKTVIIISVILAILIGLYFGKNIIAKTSVSAGVRAMTGLKLSIRSMNVGILKTLIGIKELQLYNPPGFVDELMVDIPEIYVDYNLGAFIKGKAHLEEVRMNLKEFVIVKNEKGELNLDSLKVVEAKEEVEEEKDVSEKRETEMPELQIDVLELKIGKVIYKDYSKGIPPKVKEFNVNIDERHENIKNPYTFGSLIIFKALKNTTIARLANFDIGKLQKGITGTVKKATEKARETTGKAVEVGKSIGEKVKGPAKETTEKATETIKKLLPFGK